MTVRRLLDVIADIFILLALAVAGVGHFLPWFEIRGETVHANAPADAADDDAGDDPAADAGDDPAADAGDDPAADAGDTPDADAGDEPPADAGDDPAAGTGDAPEIDAEDDAGDDAGEDAAEDAEETETLGGNLTALDYQTWYAARSGIALAVTALMVGMSLTLNLGAGTRKVLVFLMFASMLVALAFQGMIWTPFPVSETHRQFAASNWHLNGDEYLVALLSTAIAAALCLLRMAWTMTVSPERR